MVMHRDVHLVFHWFISLSKKIWQEAVGGSNWIKIRSEQMGYTWWLIPLSKWVVTLVISGLTLLLISLYNQGYDLLSK